MKSLKLVGSLRCVIDICEWFEIGKLILVGEMWTLYDIVKRGFEDGPLSFLYRKLWKKKRKECFIGV